MEYKVIQARNSNLETTLNELAQEGWHLTAMTSPGAWEFIVILERQKK